MESGVLNFVIGYAIAINLISISFIWINAKTELIKMDGKWLGLTFLILSAIGGFIGVLVGNEMLDYKQDSKLFRIVIPIIVFIEACVIAYIMHGRIG